jgi:anaerobic carbon-monoxide dehydrogenase catalytic subunit
MADEKQRSIDPAAQQVIRQAADDEVELVWDRYDEMQPQCGFGQLGVCCRICHMGPCRIDPFGEGPQVGICGADADAIAARNLVRMIAGGASAHMDHGRAVAGALLEAARNPDSGYEIRDPHKLMVIADEYGLATEGKSVNEIAEAVAEKALAEFGQQEEGEIQFPLRAPAARVKLWRDLDIMPRGMDREVVQLIHQTHMGVDADYRNIMKQGLRTALADGWGGSMIATDLQDILFGSPEPIRSKTNLGVLDEKKVNIVVHGHEPVLSEMMVEAARDPELIERAKALGATGINLVGQGCTGNELLMRQGIPSAGSFLHQELAVMTGAAEAMVVDVQCIMPALADLSERFHTKLLTTSPRAKMPRVQHLEFHEAEALATAKEIIALGIDNFAKRDARSVHIPDEQMDLVGGFTAEYINTLLGGRFRPSYRPLNDAIMAGRIRGVAGVVGCENPEIPQGYGHIEMAKELIKNDVLVVVTGCSALADAREGLLRPEAAFELAGPGLQEVCEAIGMPPVLHVGSCVDNSRILVACANMVAEGGLGEDISDLPVAGAAPEWMSEKAISIGYYVVASGIYTVFGTPQNVLGAPELHKYVVDDLEEIVGARFDFEADPIKAAHMMIAHIDKKREALKLAPMMYAQAAKAASV